MPQLGNRSLSAKSTWNAKKKHKLNKDNGPLPSGRRVRKSKNGIGNKKKRERELKSQSKQSILKEESVNTIIRCNRTTERRG